MTLVKYQTASPFNRFFNDFFLNPAFDHAPTNRAYQPAVNIAETEKGFRLEIAAPGLNKEDISIKVEKDQLLIAGKKTEQNNEDTTKYHRREFALQQFERSFRLPETIDTDHVTANLVNGVLHIDLVKKPENQAVAKTIEIG
jgi:HSP20 family protein